MTSAGMIRLPLAAEVKSLYDFQVPGQGHLETLRRLGPPGLDHHKLPVKKGDLRF
jgi:hypothetical protein